MKLDFLTIFDAFWQIDMLHHSYPLYTNPLTLITVILHLTPTSITLWALFPYPIVADDEASASTFEAAPRSLGHVSSATFARVTDNPFV